MKFEFVFLFQTGSIRSFLFYGILFRPIQVSIPNWFD